tara:strand:+ start:698 stop:1093 length:396 start_codon:yes stop_codon:yes gene_type:complete
MFHQLNTDSTKEDITKYLKELASNRYAYHIDDDPLQIEWDGAGKPDTDTLTLIIANAGFLHNQDVMSWDEVWEVYGSTWRIHDKVVSECARLLDQYGVIETGQWSEFTPEDKAILFDWSESIMDSINKPND